MNPYKNKPIINETKIKYDKNLILYNQKIIQQITITKYKSHNFKNNIHTLLLNKISSLTKNPNTLIKY